MRPGGERNGPPPVVCFRGLHTRTVIAARAAAAKNSSRFICALVTFPDGQEFSPLLVVSTTTTTTTIVGISFASHISRSVIFHVRTDTPSLSRGGLYSSCIALLTSVCLFFFPNRYIYIYITLKIIIFVKKKIKIRIKTKPFLSFRNFVTVKNITSRCR